MTDLHIAVLGGGSVGLCLAASFAAAGARVTLLVRATSVAALQGQPLRVTGKLGDHCIPAGQIRIADAAAPDAASLSCDLLAVTTKAYDVGSALEPFAAQGARPAVLLLQNGMGAAEIARATLGPDAPIYSTAMMIGMVRHGPTEVEVSAQSSPIQCGALLGDETGLLKRAIALAENGFVPIAYDAGIRETIAFKLLFNTCMNPTGALIGRTYGQLLENPHSRAFIAELADETLAAFAAAYAYRPARNGKEYVDDVLSGIVFPRAAGHRSSMVQDIEAGRRTEIDFLNGAVVDLARSVGQSAPRHESIRALIRARESAA
ncbi:MAG: 2-dehydropantoate 2-reductase [Pseudomonadota bacterium]